MLRPGEVETGLVLFSSYKSFFLGYKHFLLFYQEPSSALIAPCSQKVLEAGETIFLAEDPFLNLFLWF